MFYISSRMCHYWIKRYPDHWPHAANIRQSRPGSYTTDCRIVSSHTGLDETLIRRNVLHVGQCRSSCTFCYSYSELKSKNVSQINWKHLFLQRDTVKQTWGHNHPYTHIHTQTSAIRVQYLAWGHFDRTGGSWESNRRPSLTRQSPLAEWEQCIFVLIKKDYALCLM